MNAHLHTHIFKLAKDILKMCESCHGLGQLKGYQTAPISVNDFGKVFDGDYSFSHIITRCKECVGTGERIDWNKWCELKQNYPWHVIQEVEKIFDNYFQEVPS